MPQTVTKDQLAAEDFLERALRLHGLVTSLGDTSSSAEIPTILQQVHNDLVTYSHTAQGNPPDAGDGVAQAPLTSAQMQDAAWYGSGATQADMIIRQFSYRLSHAPIKTDAQTLYVDITGDSAGLHLNKVVSDLQALLKELDAAVAQMNMLVGLHESDGGALTLKSCAGALLHYMGPTLETLNGARASVAEAIDPASVDPLNRQLTALTQGHALVGKDGNAGACLGTP